MRTFSKLLFGISLASAVFAAPKPDRDISIHLGDYGVSSRRFGAQPEKGVTLLTFDKFKIKDYLKPKLVGPLKWQGPWMMFNGENVHYPGVVSKPNAILIENIYDLATIEAIDGFSPWPSFRIESFWATRLLEPKIWPLPPLAASLICETPEGKKETYTQVKPIVNPGAPIKFDNWQPMICTKITFRIGYPNKEGGVAIPSRFSMDDLSIMSYTLDNERQHGQLKA